VREILLPALPAIIQRVTTALSDVNSVSRSDAQHVSSALLVCHSLLLFMFALSTLPCTSLPAFCFVLSISLMGYRFSLKANTVSKTEGTRKSDTHFWKCADDVCKKIIKINPSLLKLQLAEVGAF